MTLNPQIPLPSFEDLRKILQFWIDQQDKWFYFETAIIQSGTSGESEIPSQPYTKSLTSWATKNETNLYIQTRIVGKINDVITYPPSLLLRDVSIFIVSLVYKQLTTNLLSSEKRDKYGLVFSQITYYEPINDVETFLTSDARVTTHRSK